MEQNKFLWAVIFGVLFIIGIEYLIARHKGLKIFRFQNTITNLLMGFFDRIAGLFMVPLIYIYYEYLYVHFALLSIPETALYFALAVLVTDFIWYFYHRSGHKINLFWGAHIIHHQSEDYNYTVALNLTPFQVIVRIAFWSLMPIIGFTPKVVLGTHLVIGLYQFLLHTTLIPKLGFIEKFMVTPSHHRVHHGSNEEYLDKNFGGILIIWDKLFGSFQEEQNAVVYGITKDINTRAFLTTVFHYYSNLLFQMRQLSFKNKLLLFFKGPDWIPDSGAMKLSKDYIDKGTYNYQKYSTTKITYIVFSVILLISLLSVTAYFMADLSNLNRMIFCTTMLLSIIIISKLIENKNVLILEIIKYISIIYITYILWTFTY